LWAGAKAQAYRQTVRPIVRGSRDETRATRCGATPHSPVESTPLRRGIDPMHQIVFWTALTATTGLFGGGRGCGPQGCGMRTTGYSACAPQYGYGQACGYGGQVGGYNYNYNYNYRCQPGTPCGGA